MTKTANLGFPRIGKNRELKKVVEAYWKDNISQEELQKVAAEIRKENWQLQKANNIDYIPSNDFSFYDQILDTSCLLGAIPRKYNVGEKVNLDTYFAMARGLQKGDIDVPAMEMTKWFDTNYHYIVPEFTKNQKFSLKSSKIFDEYQEAEKLGIKTRPVLVGPVSFLYIGKEKEVAFNKYDLIDGLVEVYQEIIAKLASIGVKDLQIDEPALITDLNDEVKNLYKRSYQLISKKCQKLGINLHLTTYFADLADNLQTYYAIEAESYHIDLVRDVEQLDLCLEQVPAEKTLSLGVIDGRNVWINNLDDSLSLIKKAVAKLGSNRVIIAPSCSLLHSPIDLSIEDKLEQDIKSWLAFAINKLEELKVLKEISNNVSDKTNDYFVANKNAINSRKTSLLVNNQEVQARVSNLQEADYHRKNDYEVRIKKQAEILNLPLFPTTTIGSFPQTKEVRKARSDYKKGIISAIEYESFLEKETLYCLKKQEDLGIDVLVHGEFERNDMVEYFGEKLSGFTFTKNAWVQSYGSRCVKPPIIFGDVSRNEAMTIKWSEFANNNSQAEVKGMLTGPVTILQWSFVRDDQLREITCKQIALAIRDEVADLENVGIKIIQIDEPAIREGLPIHQNKRDAYLKWAVDSFKLSASVAKDETQIHTHMCYSEFNNIIKAISDMDADVISIETSRSQMKLLDVFVNFEYPNEIGPGVYDIHSPRVPNKEEMKELIIKAIKLLPKEKIWVNPDCGLKTRGWPEVEEALKEMVEATRDLRKEF